MNRSRQLTAGLQYLRNKQWRRRDGSTTTGRELGERTSAPWREQYATGHMLTDALVLPLLNCARCLDTTNRCPLAGRLAITTGASAHHNYGDPLSLPTAGHHRLCRSSRMVIWGGGIFAPYATTWFKFLEGLPIKGKVATTVTRVALDQLVAAPVVLSGGSRVAQRCTALHSSTGAHGQRTDGATAFFTAMTFMEGGTWGQAKDKLRTVGDSGRKRREGSLLTTSLQSFWPTLKTNWTL